ncbi:hypothetical protein WOLCODRAFT_89215 [Wolfiporia cocos MD-104 SS10]|uniref:Zona occludens toxin N-terminal domain-containing protein n=1 Tax=Wolfiporia cocos (strain MD-104) TaxID=742152 RepID=A0A2H3JHE5_WOLCO|nr:hypothetical protein WOLCODRAFT_89215 [Wolfiporia cocos MD-104 SS10]
MLSLDLTLAPQIEPGSDCAKLVTSVDHASDELKLLGHASTSTDVGQSEEHEYKTAPLVTCDAYLNLQPTVRPSQYGVLGTVLSIEDKNSRNVPQDPRLYFNTDAPLSAIVCGVQGSGKSHTVSVMLDNMLISHYADIGNSQKALAGLVLHFGEGGPSSLPNETAWLGRVKQSGVKAPHVRVFVSKSSLQTMKQVYAPLGDSVTIEPLVFSEKELDAEAILSMMAVGSSDAAPLYMHTVLSILRDLGERFTYSAFKNKLSQCNADFNPAQKAGLKQRMALLEEFVDSSPTADKTRFAEGQLTIIDMSDPYVDPAAACSLFEIITRLFVRADVRTGKVLVVDEAHKYLRANKGNSGLTRALLSLIRQQRHLAMRVVISTQEPTVVPPVLLDLCGVTILHRFSSPSWFTHLIKHVSADISEEAFDKVVRLRTGEAMVFAPAGLWLLSDALSLGGSGSETMSVDNKRVMQFGRRYLLVKSRQRVTADGGASILVVGP